mgnify:CR=1 FL=1
MADRMTERLPDLYDKSDDSNVNKLFRILSSEIDEVNGVVEKAKDWRDVDQMKGEALDRLGDMLGTDRQGRDDFHYRRIIKLQIVINQSKGNIETINEVANTLLGNSYLELEENWFSEPASFFIVYDYFDLYGSIIQEYQDYEDDPYFLDGEYNLDGERLLNGGITFDLAGALSDILKLINNTKHTIELAVAAGIKVYYKIPIDIENNINIEQILDKKIEKQVEENINIEQELAKMLTKDIKETATNYLDGSHNLDGELLLDAERERMQQKLNIEVI